MSRLLEIIFALFLFMQFAICAENIDNFLGSCENCKKECGGKFGKCYDKCKSKSGELKNRCVNFCNEGGAKLNKLCQRSGNILQNN